MKSSTPTYPAFKRSVTIDEVKKAKKERHGWVKLDFNDKWKDIAANKQIMLTVNGEFDFNEIAFVGTDGKLLSVSLEKLDYWYERKDGSVVMNAKNKTRLNRRSVYRFQAYVSFPEARNFSKIRGRFQSHSDTREVERRFRLRKG